MYPCDEEGCGREAEHSTCGRDQCGRCHTSFLDARRELFSDELEEISFNRGTRNSHWGHGAGEDGREKLGKLAAEGHVSHGSPVSGGYIYEGNSGGDEL